MMNTMGQGSTPTLSTKLRCGWPSRLKSAFATPSRSSSWKSFTPIISASRALAAKKPPSTRYNRVALSERIEWITAGEGRRALPPHHPLQPALAVALHHQQVGAGFIGQRHPQAIAQALHTQRNGAA